MEDSPYVAGAGETPVFCSFFFFFKIILLLNLQYIILYFAHEHKTESSLFGDNSEQYRMNATLA